MKTGLELHLRAELSEIRRLSAALEEFARTQAIPERAAMRMMLVLDELLTNTISYGYPDRKDGEIRVAVARCGDRVEIAVTDDGIAFDPTQTRAPALDTPLEERDIGGLGVHLVKTMADVGYSRDGGRNIVTLSVPLDEGMAAAAKRRR